MKSKSILDLKHFGFCILLLCSIVAKSQRQVKTIEHINQLIAEAKSTSLKDTIATKKHLQEAIVNSISLKNDTCLAKAYEVYGIMYARRGFNKEGLSYFKKQLEASKRSGYDSYLANALINISNVQSELGDNKGSIQTALQSLQLFQKLNNKSKQGNVLMNIGITYISMGDYTQAMQYQLQALAIREQLNNKYDMAYSQHALATLYSRMKNNDKALAYNYKALKIFQELKDEAISASIIFNIAIIKIRLKSYSEAKQRIESIIPYFQKLNKAESLRKCYVQLSNIAELQCDEKGSEHYLSLALQYSKLNGSATNDVGILINRARLNMLQKKYTESENDLYLAQEKALKSTDYFNIINVKRQFLTLYQESGQVRKSQLMLNEYDQLKDSVLNETNMLQLNELQTKYETEKKANQITLLDRENHIKSLQLANNSLVLGENKFLIDKQQQQLTINQLELQNKNQLVRNQKLDAERKAQDIKTLKKQSQIQTLEIVNKELDIKRRNLLIFFILMVFIAMGIVSLLFYNRYRLKQQNLLQAEIFKQQEIAARSLFEGEQQERIRIARDLHDSLGQMLSVVKMNLSTMSDIEAEHSLTKNTASLVDKTIEEVRHISHNLIPEELNFGLFGAIENLCDKITASEKTKATLSIPEDLQHYKFEKQNELGIYRIVQEVLHNMVKHAGATEIGISVSRRKHLMIIQIRDNGKGFDTNDIKKSSGLGWKNIAARVSMLNGELQVSSEILTGTAIEISIPEWNTQATA